jgi:hypothetical protein
LFSLVAVLIWLALMFRRSGLGSPKLLPATSLIAGDKSVASLPPGTQQEVKDRALAELTSFAKESLVQGLYSQRAALLAVHEQAQKELAELEARVEERAHHARDHGVAARRVARVERTGASGATICARCSGRCQTTQELR